MSMWNKDEIAILKPIINTAGECFNKLLANTPNYDYANLERLILELMDTETSNIKEVKINFGPNRFKDYEDFYSNSSWADYAKILGNIDQYLNDIKFLPAEEQYKKVCDIKSDAYLKIYFNTPILLNNYENFENKLTGRIKDMNAILEAYLLDKFSKLNNKSQPEYLYKLVNSSVSFSEEYKSLNPSASFSDKINDLNKIEILKIKFTQEIRMQKKR